MSNGVSTGSMVTQDPGTSRRGTIIVLLQKGVTKAETVAAVIGRYISCVMEI